jgi:hypothetical protein
MKKFLPATLLPVVLGFSFLAACTDIHKNNIFLSRNSSSSLSNNSSDELFSSSADISSPNDRNKDLVGNQLERIMSRSIYPDFLGYNGDNNLGTKGNPWDDRKLKQAFVHLVPGNLRYPDGSPANYWDWRAGKVDTKLDSSKFRAPWWMGHLFNEGSMGRYDLQNLQKGVLAANASVVFNLNVVTDNEGVGAGNPDYQIEMLKKWQGLGMPLNYVELGNELYAMWEESLIAAPDWISNNPGYTAKYQNIPGDYTREMKTWIAKIRQELGNDVKIALVGGSSPIPEEYYREKLWNIDLNDNFEELFGEGKADAITIHHYYNTSSNPISTTPVSKFIVDGLESWNYSLNETLLKWFDRPQFAELVDVWVTEFNIDGSGEGQWYDTWAHALYITAVLNQQLLNKQINLINYHGLYGGVFGAIKEDLSYSNPGRVLKLFGEAMKGMTSAENFKLKQGNEPMLDGKYPAYFIWRFSNKSKKKAIVANLSSKQMTIDPTELKLNQSTYRTIAASDPKIKTTVNYEETKTFDGPILVPPYSVTLLGGSFQKKSLPQKPLQAD